VRREARYRSVRASNPAAAHKRSPSEPRCSSDTRHMRLSLNFALLHTVVGLHIGAVGRSPPCTPAAWPTLRLSSPPPTRQTCSVQMGPRTVALGVAAAAAVWRQRFLQSENKLARFAKMRWFAPADDGGAEAASCEIIGEDADEAGDLWLSCSEPQEQGLMHCEESVSLGSGDDWLCKVPKAQGWEEAAT